MGVSTSKKLFSSKYFLTIFIILDLKIKVSKTSLLDIKSNHLFLYLTPLSAIPLCFSGRGRSVLHRIVTFFAKMVISPFCVTKILPSIPKISPRSIFFYKNFIIIILVIF